MCAFCLIFILKQIKYFVVETWILFRKNKELVSKVILEAYQHYEAMEFGRKKDGDDIANPNRHIKLINVYEKEVRYCSETNILLHRYSELFLCPFRRREGILLC